MHGEPLRDCFICHASEDKDAVARPIAAALVKAGYEVWFDEFELRLGDSLREKIDEGLSTSRFGVVVLSESFFAKRWPKAELEALFAKEMINGERLILPVWHEIDEQYLAARSPLLAGRVGVASTPLGTALTQIVEVIDRRRDRSSATAATVDRPSPTNQQPAPDIVGLVERREGLKLRLTDSALTRIIRLGSGSGPPCLSVIAAPIRLQPYLFDPAEVSAKELDRLSPDGLWAPAYQRDFGAPDVDHTGFRWSVGSPGRPPVQWRRIDENGLMEYGVDLSRRGKPIEPNRESLVPMTLAAHLVHDSAMFFLKAFEIVGFTGEAALLANFDNIQGSRLGLNLNHYLPARQRVKVDRLVSRPLRGTTAEALAQVGHWTRKTMDRLLLTAEVTHGFQEIDERGELLDLPRGRGYRFH